MILSIKRLYHSLLAKYYVWRVKRFYKRLFREMPMRHDLFIAEDGKLVCVDSNAELWMVAGSGIGNQNWPAFKGYRTDDYELD